MSSSINLQHVNVKLLARDPEDVNLEPLIPVFHNWIKAQVFDELLLDVADYRHVHEGPGVVLVGHQANYSVDNTDNRLGVRYNRKYPLEGSNQDRLKQATRAALTAFQRLEAEAGLNGKLRFNGQGIEVFINDRLMAPNRDSTREAVKPELQAFFGKLFQGSEYTLSYGSDPRSLFGVYVNSNRAFLVADLLSNLAS
jgi:hypothetical protein